MGILCVKLEIKTRVMCVCLQLKVEEEASYESTVEERQIWVSVYNNGSTVLHNTC